MQDSMSKNIVYLNIKTHTNIIKANALKNVKQKVMKVS